MVERIGWKIKVLREQSGYTQRNIANYLQVDLDFLEMVEEGSSVLKLPI